MSVIQDTLGKQDPRELPSESGPRGVQDTSSPPPQVVQGGGGLDLTPPEPTVLGEEDAQAQLSQTQQDVSNMLGRGVGELTGAGDPNLTPVPVGNPLLDPSTYTNAFTREAQDRASVHHGVSGTVPTYTGGSVVLPEVPLPERPNLPPLQPALFRQDESSRSSSGTGQGGGVYYGPAFPGGNYYGPALPEEFGPYQQDILDRFSETEPVRPTRNAAQQGAAGIGGLLGLGRRAITGLFRGTQAAGEAVTGQDNPNRRGVRGFLKDVGDQVVGGMTPALLVNSQARKAFLEEFQREFNGLGSREQEAIRQLSPTNGAGKAGLSGPLSGDFGEYGTSWLGGAQYTLDGIGNQIRANIAANMKVHGTPIPLNPFRSQELIERERVLAAKYAREAWMGRDFSFLNPDSPISVFDKDAPLSWKSPIKAVAGVVLDSVTGPDIVDILGHARNIQRARKTLVGPRAAKPITRGGALVPSPNGAVVPSTPTPGGVLDLVEVNPRPYPKGLPSGQRGGDLARRASDTGGELDLIEVSPRLYPPGLPETGAISRTSTEGGGGLARQYIDIDPYPVPPRLPQIGLPPGPPQNLLPGVGTQRALPPSGGLDMTPLVSLPTDSPDLDAIRVLVDLPEGVGVVDVSPALPRPLRSDPEVLAYLVDDSAPGTGQVFDLNTGRLKTVEAPDLEVAKPQPEDIVTLDVEAEVLDFGVDDFPQDDLVQDILDQEPPRPLRGPQETPEGPSSLPKAQTPSPTPEAPQAQAEADVARRMDQVAQANRSFNDTFTQSVRNAPPEVLRNDIDLPNKVLAHAEAAGTVVTTNRGAVVRGDQVVQAAQRRLIDLRIKQDTIKARLGGGDVPPARRGIMQEQVKALQDAIDDVRTTITKRPLRKLQADSPVLTPDEVDQLIPPVTVAQATPTPSASVVVEELRAPRPQQDGLSLAFDLQAVDKGRLVHRFSYELESLARFMGHWSKLTSPTTQDLAKLHDQYGLYARYGPALDRDILDDAVKRGIRRIEQVKPNKALGVVGQSTIIRGTPAVMGSKFNSSVKKAADLGAIPGEVGASLIRGDVLEDATFRNLIQTWVGSDGRGAERRALNAVFAPGGYSPTPGQIQYLVDEFGPLSNKAQSKLPKRLRDILKEPPLPTPPSQGDTSLRGLIDAPPGTSITEALEDIPIPPELREADLDIKVRQLEVRAELQDARASLVEAETELQSVIRQRGELYQELAGLPEMEPRNVMDGTWDNQRLNDRVKPTVGQLDTVPPTNLEPSPNHLYVDVEVDTNWYMGSPFLGSFESPNQANRLGSMYPLRGATPPGFMVLTNEALVAESLAKGRVPENTPVTNLLVQPAVAQVYPDLQRVVDGNVFPNQAAAQALTSSLYQGVGGLDTPNGAQLQVLLGEVDLTQMPLGRVVNRLQDAWGKLYPDTPIGDELFAQVALGYRNYIAGVGDAVVYRVGPKTDVLLVPNPQSLRDEHIMLDLDLDDIEPSAAALARTYANESLLEDGSLVGEVLRKNDQHQYALEVEEELIQRVQSLTEEYTRLVNQDQTIRSAGEEVSEQVKQARRDRIETQQQDRIAQEFETINELDNPQCL